MTQPVAVVAGLCVDRSGRRVLDDVTLDLAAGTVTLLAGPNGAGKTTLMRVLTGSIVPRAGHVRVMGYDPSRERRARAAVGLVPQEIALYPRLTVRENLETFAAFSGAPATRALLDHCLARTGLSTMSQALVSTLSGGYQRRANIACALVGRPRLLLLDEPLVGLDPIARRAICADLSSLARLDGVAMLLATHDLEDAERIATVVTVLQAGRIVAKASPADLVARLFPQGSSRIELILMNPPDEGTKLALGARGYAPTAEATIWRATHRSAMGSPGPAPSDIGLPLASIREMRQRCFRLDDAYEAIVGGSDAA